jgi:hypothetical protein
MDEIVLRQRIESKIYFIRGQKVMLDSDLAELYGVKTKELNKAVKRNKEIENLRSQIGTSSWGGRRYLPYAYTEQGVAMLSSVLRSKRAIYVNIQIMRTFTKLREILSTHKDLQRKIEEMEKKYDQQFKIVFDAIKALLQHPEPKKRPIGFIREKHIEYKTKRK